MDRTPLVRLENLTSTDPNRVDRLIKFVPDTGQLSVDVLDQPIECRGLEQRHIVHERLAGWLQPGTPYRLVHNRPVPGAYSAPFKLFLDINMSCQIRCSFCLSDTRNGVEDELPLQRIKELAQEARELGVMYVKLGGGEPTLHSELAGILACLYEAGLYITTSTNSLDIDDRIVDLLKTYEVGVSVSLSGVGRTNDRLMKKRGHFDIAVAVAKRLRDAGVNVRFRTTLLRENMHQLADIVTLAKETGLKAKFSYCRPAGRAVRNNSMLGPGDAPRYLEAIAYLNHPDVLPHVILDEGMTLVQDPAIAQRQGIQDACGAGKRSFHIDAFGNVSPCIFLGEDYTAPTLLRSGTILDYWSGGCRRTFDAARGIAVPSLCKSCSRACKNECPATRLYHGDAATGGQDPNCLRTALRTAGVTDSLETWTAAVQVLPRPPEPGSATPSSWSAANASTFVPVSALLQGLSTRAQTAPSDRK